MRIWMGKFIKIGIGVVVGFAVLIVLSLSLPLVIESDTSKYDGLTPYQTSEVIKFEQSCKSDPNCKESVLTMIENYKNENNLSQWGKSPQSSEYSSQDCSGNTRCIINKVTQVTDGDTINVGSQAIRFALSSAPELYEFNGPEARNFISEICPVGSEALVDEDDGQTQGSYGRVIGVIYCNGVNLNEELLDAGLGYLSSEFCDSGEFANDLWAVKHGCTSSPVSIPEIIPEIRNNCDHSYPDFCIPTSPPDLDCGDISQKRFTVLQPDPHRFDGDKDGIGCES